MRTELAPHGFEIYSVAMDTGGPDAVRRFVEAADPDFPVVIDRAHLLGELLGISNVPSGVWIDEDGMIVRPPETAFPSVPQFSRQDPDDPAVQARMTEGELARLRTVRPLVSQMRIEPDAYVAALRDWVANGKASRFALPPEEVIERSAPRRPEIARAAASFELGQHLHRQGHTADAIRWFRESHRLQPDNWTYKRQAWTLNDSSQGPTPQYDGDWASDVRRSGPENYYQPARL